MSLVIRLARMGKKGERRFRLVVAEKRSRREGKPIEMLGWYHKNETGEKKEINMDRVSYWLSQGAKASQTVAKIVHT